MIYDFISPLLDFKVNSRPPEPKFLHHLEGFRKGVSPNKNSPVQDTIILPSLEQWSKPGLVVLYTVGEYTTQL